ncbi:MCE family protein [Nocardia sp. NPDC003963]
MQRVNLTQWAAALNRWFDRDQPITDEPTKMRKQLRLGVIGVCAVAALAVAVGALYVVPLGKRTYTAELSEAQSVKPGDDVRLAGVPVGEVKSLELEPDRVTMTFTVDRDVFVGDRSSLDIRMLTLVGGHYVALFPAGGEELGDEPIPADRVRLPYSLMETFQDATAPLRETDGDTLRRNLAALDTSIDAAPESLRSVLDTVGSYLDAIERQRSQVSNAIATADEYVTMYDGAKTDLGRLMDNVNLMETVLLDKRAELKQALALLSSVVQRVSALAPAWDDTLQPRVRQLADALPRFEEYGRGLEPMIVSAQSLSTKLRELVGPDGGVRIDRSGTTVTAPGAVVCIPLPGKAC